MRRTIVNPEEITAERRPQERKRGPGTPAAGQPPPQPVEADGFKDRLLKYIPAEVLTLYLAIDGLLRARPPSPALSWALFVFGLLATVLYLRFGAGVTKPLQLAVSAVAFCVWALAIGGPFTQIPGYDPIYGAIALPIFTFVAGFIKP